MIDDDSEAPENNSVSGGDKRSWKSRNLFSLTAAAWVPNRWSLKMRFLYVTGGLLALGVTFQILFLALTLHKDIERSAANSLELIRSQAAGKISRAEDYLLAQALAAASMDQAGQALATGDRAGLHDLAVPFSDGLRLGSGLTSLHMGFFDSQAQAAWLSDDQAAWGQDNSGDPFVAAAVAERLQSSGVSLGRLGLLLKAAAPIIHNSEPTGAVSLSVLVMELLEELNIPSTACVSILLHPEQAGQLAPNASLQPAGGWLLHNRFGSSISEQQRHFLEDVGLPGGTTGEAFFTSFPLYNTAGQLVAAVLIGHNAALQWQIMRNRMYQLGGLFAAGAVVLWFILYFNVLRIESFLKRLRKIIVATHSSDFGERFETDHVHCLEYMHCHNEECPVYKDPSRICYLETGSEAISPQWRDTCVFLNKYDTCKSCPVYELRRGDELSEMRNVVNTMVRLWSNFLNTTGHLLAYVLRKQETTGVAPTLNDVSAGLEQMAKLTFFSHDLQGVMDKAEVYDQLAYVFEHNFRISRYVMFEVDNDTDRIFLALDKTEAMPLCKKEVLLTSENCRAKRVSEDVFSFYNPVLCPHFNCNTDDDVRVCLPMVMGGQVGAIFSFLAPRSRWEILRKDLPVIRKYLDESAPVLSSLRLLLLTKDQALRDPLTLCHNRRFLDEFIAQYEPLSERENRRTGFLMADLDYFKQVNDQYGHEAGDLVLQQVVSIVENTIRRSDLLIRYGGEEFLVLLQDVHNGMAENVAEKIRLAVENHRFDLGDGVYIHKTISVGVSEYPQDGSALYKCIKFADVALYAAKNAGRNRVKRFKQEMWTGEAY